VGGAEAEGGTSIEGIQRDRLLVPRDRTGEVRTGTQFVGLFDQGARSAGWRAGRLACQAGNNVNHDHRDQGRKRESRATPREPRGTGNGDATSVDSDDREVTADRMTEEELLKGLEGLAPPEEVPEDDGE
jgi:hypothetical protein